jgi:hypothetical protein
MASKYPMAGAGATLYCRLVEIPFIFVTVDKDSKATNNTRPSGGNAARHVSWPL